MAKYVKSDTTNNKFLTQGKPYECRRVYLGDTVAAIASDYYHEEMVEVDGTNWKWCDAEGNEL